MCLIRFFDFWKRDATHDDVSRPLVEERPSGSESNDVHSPSEDGGKDSQAATSPPPPGFCDST